MTGEKTIAEDGKADKPLAKAEGPRKKRKIVVKPLPSSIEPADSKEKNKNVALTYIQRIKEAVEKESYLKFTRLMKEYKKGNNFLEMLTGLDELLLKMNQKPELFKDFYHFVRPSHKKEFHLYCISHTGQGCGYKPEDSISRKQKELLQKENKAEQNMGELSSSSLNHLDNKTNMTGL